MEREAHIRLLKDLATVINRIEMTIEFNNPDETVMTGRDFSLAPAWIREAAIHVRDVVEQETGLLTEGDAVIDPDFMPTSDFLFL